jgi:hypothetical protein
MEMRAWGDISFVLLHDERARLTVHLLFIINLFCWSKSNGNRELLNTLVLQTITSLSPIYFSTWSSLAMRHSRRVTPISNHNGPTLWVRCMVRIHSCAFPMQGNNDLNRTEGQILIRQMLVQCMGSKWRQPPRRRLSAKRRAEPLRCSRPPLHPAMLRGALILRICAPMRYPGGEQEKLKSTWCCLWSKLLLNISWRGNHLGAIIPRKSTTKYLEVKLSGLM